MNVRIYQPTKNAMQSGRGRSDTWKIALDASAPQTVEPLMGWVSMSDMSQELRLSFSTREAAIAYAEKQGYDFRVIEPKERVIIPKSYAANFSPDRIM